jgi:PII-like signaling protein
MNDECLKLTSYFGERDRANGGFLADAFTEIYVRHELKASLVMRGVAGFGHKHHLRTDRLLTLSEDLPIVSVAVDVRDRIERALADVERLRFDGLVTLERARMVTRDSRVAEPGESTKLTVYLGRQERIGNRPAYVAVVALLRRRGIAGATVLLGVDGTVHGSRERARFFGRNQQVPLMVIAVGDTEQVSAVVPELSSVLTRPLITLERIRVCKRDGQLRARPTELPQTDPSGLGVWQKLMIYAGEQSRHGGRPLYQELIRALRKAGAAGATSLRGIWGYHGDHEPHGDRLFQARRRVPVVTVVVDSPQRTRQWFEIVDEITDETGLVTSELVPAFRATGPDIEHGGLRLAQLSSR